MTNPEPGLAWGSRGLRPTDNPFSTSKLWRKKGKREFVWVKCQILDIKQTNMQIYATAWRGDEKNIHPFINAGRML